jgi:7-carboxy-7-deazaguanine synthase
MKVSECFKSIQGEGPQVGMVAWFIRTSGCDLSCSYCDSKYAKDGAEMAVEDIVKTVCSDNCNNIVVTGGEPLMQIELEDLVKELTKKKKKIYIETNGTFYKPNIIGFCSFIVSPKFDFINSDYLEVLMKWTQHATFKFVIRDRKDFDTTLSYCELLGLKNNVYFMPEGIRDEDIKKKMLQLVEWVKEKAPFVRVSSRLHVYLWGAKRGI